MRVIFVYYTNIYKCNELLVNIIQLSLFYKSYCLHDSLIIARYIVLELAHC